MITINSGLLVFPMHSKDLNYLGEPQVAVCLAVGRVLRIVAIEFVFTANNIVLNNAVTARPWDVGRPETVSEAKGYFCIYDIFLGSRINS